LSKKKKYTWDDINSPPKIDNHSLVKLDIIEKYIEIYLRHLTKSFYVGNFKLTIIDGFAGGGLYEGGITGSPIRAKETIDKITQIINFEKEQSNCKKVHFDIDYIFIEKDKGTFIFLNKTLRNRGIAHANVECINGEFTRHLDTILSRVSKKSRGGRSIFILDQYGYKDAPIKDINKIFKQLVKTEVILTFSTDSLIDYLSECNISTLEKMGLTKQQCAELLNIREDNDYTRSKIQPLLYRSVIEQAGAPFYTPFFIKSDLTNRSYWLFHFSMHPLARDEMIGLHWNKQNTFQHFGSAGLNMLLGYNSDYRFNLFEFDNFAKEKTLKCLSDELPLVVKNKKIIQFDMLKNEIMNGTPAKTDHIKEVLINLAQNNIIKIQDSKNNTQRKSINTIKDNDLIKYNGQKIFIFS
jgi:three-Cys-motif partner protein